MIKNKDRILHIFYTFFQNQKTVKYSDLTPSIKMNVARLQVCNLRKEGLIESLGTKNDAEFRLTQKGIDEYKAKSQDFKDKINNVLKLPKYSDETLKRNISFVKDKIKSLSFGHVYIIKINGTFRYHKENYDLLRDYYRECIKKGNFGSFTLYYDHIKLENNNADYKITLKIFDYRISKKPNMITYNIEIKRLLYQNFKDCLTLVYEFLDLEFKKTDCNQKSIISVLSKDWTIYRLGIAQESIKEYGSYIYLRFLLNYNQDQLFVLDSTNNFLQMYSEFSYNDICDDSKIKNNIEFHTPTKLFNVNF